MKGGIAYDCRVCAAIQTIAKKEDQREGKGKEMMEFSVCMGEVGQDDQKIDGGRRARLCRMASMQRAV